VSADPEWIETLRARLLAGGRADIAEAGRLFTEASDDQLQALAALVRGRYHAPGVATYLVMAIINTTNVCVARCDYCAFYKLPGQQGSYLLSYEQLCERIDALRSLVADPTVREGTLSEGARESARAEKAAALRKALVLRRPPQGLIHHSDRGSQYCSVEYQAELRRHGIRISMSGKGNCYDNAMVETFFKTIKAELVWRRTWETRRQAETTIFQYINGFYNPRRRHSALGGKSPLAFERQAA
jgi:hypothetical protein